MNESAVLDAPAEVQTDAGLLEIFEAHREIVAARGRLADAEMKCQSAKEAYDAAKGARTSARGELDEAMAKLEDLIGGLRAEHQGQRKTQAEDAAPLFDGDDPIAHCPSTSAHCKNAADGGDASSIDNRQSEICNSRDDSWRTVRLDILKDPAIPRKILELLQEHEPRIETVGDLTDWVDRKGDFWAKDIPHIGPAGCDKINAALENFWLRRRGPSTGKASA